VLSVWFKQLFMAKDAEGRDKEYRWARFNEVEAVANMAGGVLRTSTRPTLHHLLLIHVSV